MSEDLKENKQSKKSYSQKYNKKESKIRETTIINNNNNNNTIFLQGSSVSYNKAAIKRSPVLNKIVFALFAKNKN